jgi:hypothetical protein
MSFWADNTPRIINTQNWEVQGGGSDEIQRCSGVTPAVAIANSGGMSLECREYVAIIILKAMLKQMGAQHVNDFFEPDPLLATPLKTLDDMLEAIVDYKVYWSGTDQSYVTFYNNRGVPTDPQSMVLARQTDFDDLLRSIPIGSRVCFTNLDADDLATFRNENSVYLGNGEFTALGFAGRRIYSARRICDELAQCTPLIPNPAIAITMIEHYVFRTPR